MSGSEAMYHLGDKRPRPAPISEDEWQEAKRLTEAWRACLILPNGWLEMRIPTDQYPELEGQCAFQHRDGRRVIGTVGKHDGKVWLHVSVSRRTHIPSYEDLADVKAVFVGEAVQALQVFPRRERHVNIHPYCLHLWASLEPDGDGLPDFGREGTI